MGERSESRENARASGEAARGRGSRRGSRVLARLALLAQIGELASRLSLLEFNSRKITNSSQIERDGISAIKFEAALQKATFT